MKNNKQTQELENKLLFIDEKYQSILEYFGELLDDGYQMHLLDDIIVKAKAWDIYRAKCGKGGKVASKNLSKKERIERARKASRSRECVQGKKKGRRTTKKSSI